MKPLFETTLPGLVLDSLIIGWSASAPAGGADVNIGLNIPTSGPYRVQGI